MLVPVCRCNLLTAFLISPNYPVLLSLKILPRAAFPISAGYPMPFCYKLLPATTFPISAGYLVLFCYKILPAAASRIIFSINVPFMQFSSKQLIDVPQLELQNIQRKSYPFSYKEPVNNINQFAYSPHLEIRHTCFVSSSQPSLPFSLIFVPLQKQFVYFWTFFN